MENAPLNASSIEAKNLFALTPWNDLEDTDERALAEYALIWHGDIGCGVGSGSVNPHISIIKFSTADFAYVYPLKSSPKVKFDVPVHGIISIIKFSKRHILLSAYDWGCRAPNIREPEQA